MISLTSGVTSHDGTRLAVRTWGHSDGPPVVLIHGLGLSMRSWGRVPELLAGGRRVIAYDLRGHGRSAKATTGDYALSTHASDLGVVLESTVADDRRAVVVGSSLGGGIILAHAHDSNGERVAGAVFAGSGGSGITFPGFPARTLPDWSQGLLRFGWLQALRGVATMGRWVGPVESVSNRIIRRFAFTPDAPQGAVDQVRKKFFSTRPEALARTTLASVSHNGILLAPYLTVPTLVLHGDRDPEVPQEEIRKLMSMLPNAKLVTFPDAGHLLAFARGDSVAEHIAGWVRHLGDVFDRPTLTSAVSDGHAFAPE